jgi:FkbH-like protein
MTTAHSKTKQLGKCTMKTIKLVIWDLDDTFWEGTLSEGEVIPIQANIELVKQLTDRGVMNSISSKNDFDKAKQKLLELHIWDCFIFPTISWQPKGNNIQAIIENTQLRAQNVLFLDDNHLNLEEVKFYNKEIWVETPDFIPSIDDHEAFRGKNDLKRERLAHYRILEEKAKERSSYSDNREFLNSSEIKVTFLDDFEANIDRVIELIQRTNQINYTKQRITKENLKDILSKPNYECKMVKVKDRFGEYGIVGFYALDLSANTLEHFLFSCRSMNIGLEQFIYAHLNFPKISVMGEVSVELDQLTNPDWIKVCDDWNAKVRDLKDIQSITLLLKGACDLKQMLHYLTYKNVEIHTEFNGVNDNNHPVPKASTSILLQSQSLASETQSTLIKKLPFFDEDIFSTKVFHEKYDVLVYSILFDYTMDLYKSKSSGALVPYESYSDFKRESKEQFLSRCEKHKFRNMTGKFYDNFKSDFEFIGQISPESFRDNLEMIRTKLSKPIIFINGTELNSPQNNTSEYEKAKDRHIQMNQVLDGFCAKYDNVYLLDVRKIVTKADIRHSIRHYNRNVYEEMSKELVSIVQNIYQLKFQKKMLIYHISKGYKLLYSYAREVVRQGRRLLLRS